MRTTRKVSLNVLERIFASLIKDFLGSIVTRDKVSWQEILIIVKYKIEYKTKGTFFQYEFMYTLFRYKYQQVYHYVTSICEINNS